MRLIFNDKIIKINNIGELEIAEEIEQIPVITIGLNQNNSNFDYSMQELNNLVKANNMYVVDTIVQKLDQPNAGTYFGRGKLQNIQEVANEQQVTTIVANDELSPSQIRNLEEMTGFSVIDRTSLILKIFANRAESREAKLQVELAKLQYQLPRLRTSSSDRLDQQSGSSGGSFTNRGSGEKLIEIHRRALANRINHIKHELKSITQSNQTKSKRRQNSQWPRIALVGYTNAGKSTIMNHLNKKMGNDKSEEDENVFVKNMLFATLDTKIKRLSFKDNKKILLSDTVGFVSKLPHQLIQAFKSTLAEAANADLLIQVVDYSSDNKQNMINTTKNVLKDIGITNVPMITVFNKADLTNDVYPRLEGNDIIMSANDKSINYLINTIHNKVFKNFVTKTLLIPYQDGNIINYLNKNASIEDTKYQNNGTKLQVNLSKRDFDKLKSYETKN